MSVDKHVAVFGSSQADPGSTEWADAERAGARCAMAGIGVITGGYGGAMEAASRGAASAGGHVIGVTAPPLFPGRTGANPYLVEELAADTLSHRIDLLTAKADGVLALPGSVGTAAELVVSWNMNHIARRNGGRRLPTVAVGPVWAELWDLLTGRANAEGDDVHLAESVDAALDWLLSQPEIR